MNRRIAQRVVWLIPIAMIVSLVWALSAIAAADLTDDTIANFNSGTPGACVVSPSAGDAGIDGEVVLGFGSGGMLETFSGASLPAGWSSGAYVGGTGGITVTADVLTLDGYYAGQTTPVTPTRTLDFVATFSGPRQHAGLSSDVSLNTGAWAMFSTYTSTDTLYMWTSDGVIANATLEPLGTGYFNTAHRYRIEWNTASVMYYVDGTLVATHFTPTISSNMGPVASDVNAGDASLVVDWMRMGDYMPSCTFESRVFDGGQAGNNWQLLTSTVFTPTATSVSFETRTGDAITLTDPSWSSYAPVIGGVIASPHSQYIQYRAVLSTSDARFTPELRKVVLSGQKPTAVTLSALTAQAHGLPIELPVALTLVVSVVSVGAILRRRSL